MDNFNNNTVGNSQSNTAQGTNDMNSNTSTQSPVIPTGDDILASLTGMPAPEVSNAPVGMQETPVSSSPVLEQVTPTIPTFDTTPVQGSTPAVEEIPSLVQDLPSFGGNTVEPTPVIENVPTPVESTPMDTPVVVDNNMPTQDSSAVFGASVEVTAPVEQSPVPESLPSISPEEQKAFGLTESSNESTTDTSSPSNLSQPLPSFTPATSAEATLPESPAQEVVSTLDEKKDEKNGKGGTAVVVVLIIIIVGLLATIGFFAYKIFFQ